MSRTSAKQPSSRSFSDLTPDEVTQAVDQSTGLHDDDLENRKEDYQTLVNHYYDLATDFYEFGWGQSFHFAPRLRGESFKESLLRHEYFLADQLSLKPGMQVIDLGCGIGGPMRTLARYSGASFVGLNNNAYQIKRAEAQSQDIQSLCRFIHGDFMQIPEDDNSYDAAIAIESMPHAPDKTAAFREVFRILRQEPASRVTSGASPRTSTRRMPNIFGSRKILRKGTDCRISPLRLKSAPH